jgi:putative NADPH-quinone reductase
MHITIVDGHPDRSERRFCHALATAYAEGAKQSGHNVRVITLADHMELCHRSLGNRRTRSSGPTIWLSSIHSGWATCRLI